MGEWRISTSFTLSRLYVVKVIGIYEGALRPKGVVYRQKRLGGLGVFNNLADLGPDELADGIVRSSVDIDIFEAEYEVAAAFSPAGFVECPAALLAVTSSADRSGTSMGVPPMDHLASSRILCVVGLHDLIEELGINGVVSSGDSVLSGALEYGHAPGLLGNHRYGLHAAGTRYR